MLRTFQKKQIIELLTSLQDEEMLESLLAGNGESIEIAGLCQQGAIEIGNLLDEEAEDPAPMVALLEDYCESLYNVVQSYRDEVRDIEAQKAALLAAIKQVECLFEQENVKYQVVFFPYKAAMWDSLESIWRACKEDERCQCLVIPIPYYEFVKTNGRMDAEECYDGELFPKDVPIVHYNDYILEQEKPDVVYIHNPFDEYNNVTRVNSRYFSYNLKKHAGMVVYSPYYVSAGFQTEHYMNLPMNYRVDYILAQSVFQKEYYKEYPYYDKVLPLGSPKLDRVLRLVKNPPKMPAEWKAVIGERKTLMLNTSINCMLHQGEAYLHKLRNMFEWFRTQQSVALIWRPHPLLEATLKSMRQEMVTEYREIQEYFVREKIGVLDKTPDIEITIALSDGYIGESATSVINLFQVAGKPLFILNNLIYEEYAEELQRTVVMIDIVKVRDKWYGNTSYHGLVELTNDFREVKKFMPLKIQDQDAPVYYNRQAGNMIALGEDIYLTPVSSAETWVYNTVTGRYRKLFADKEGKPLLFRGIVAWKDKLFYIPSKGGIVYRYDSRTGEIGTYTDCVKQLMDTDYTDSYEEVTAWRIAEDALWLAAVYTNKVVKLELKTGRSQVYAVGEKGMAYTDIEIETDRVWLSEAGTGNLIECDKQMQILNRYQMPEKWHTWSDALGRKRAFVCMRNMGEYLFLFPWFSNAAVRFHKPTGEMSLFMPEYYELAGKIQNGYHPGLSAACGMCKRLDEDHLYISAVGKKPHVINLKDLSCEERTTLFDKEAFNELRRKYDGFEKNNKVAEFSRKESAVFSLEEFVTELAEGKLEGIKERQQEACRTISDNLDGTCGANVHAYIMNALESK